MALNQASCGPQSHDSRFGGFGWRTCRVELGGLGPIAGKHARFSRKVHGTCQAPVRHLSGWKKMRGAMKHRGPPASNLKPGEAPADCWGSIRNSGGR